MTMNRYAVHMLVCVLFLLAIASTCFAVDSCDTCGCCGQDRDRVNSGGLRAALGGVLEGLLADEEPESESCEVVYCEDCALKVYSCGSPCDGDVCSLEETSATAPLDMEMFPPQESVDPVPVVEVSYGVWESHEYVRERSQRERPRRNQDRPQNETPEDEETSSSAGFSDEDVEVSSMPVSFETTVVMEAVEPIEIEAAGSDSVSYGPREGFAYALDPFLTTPVEAIKPTVVKLEELESSSSASSDGEETSVFFWNFENTEQVDAPAEPDA